MQIFHSFAQLQGLQRPIHWALGFFDGVHLGHRLVIRSADSPGALRGVISFEDHPLRLLKPEAAPRLLSPDPQDKEELLASLGTDIYLCLPFSRELADTSAGDFLTRLRHAAPLAGISVGSNWHFGKGGSGNCAYLQEQAAHHGFRACIAPLLQEGGLTVSSSVLRHLVEEARLEEAAAMLARPFHICGIVEHGQALARRLGFPTANIRLPECAALPPFGVYAISCRHQGQELRGLANIGIRPSISEAEKTARLEAHFRNFNGDLYGQRLCIDILRMIRPERHFPDLDTLQAQIRQDLKNT